MAYLFKRKDVRIILYCPALPCPALPCPALISTNVGIKINHVREEWPVDTDVHVQQKLTTDSSEMALLKTQVAAMTEAMRAMQVAVASLVAP